MHLKQTIQKTLNQLAESLELLSAEQYMQPAACLSNASIGQHVRHIIELFIQLNAGYPAACVNYDDRKRDREIETNRWVATQAIADIHHFLHKPDQPMQLRLTSAGSDEVVTNVHTSFYRELAYNLEHAIHHMAMIRIALAEIAAIAVGEDYGVASSTIQYRKACAQ